MRRFSFILLFLSILYPTCYISHATTLHEGTYKGAKYYIAQPDKWNKKILLLAHGLVPADRPLSAQFDSNYPPYQDMLKSGWLIAASSYRRNGMVIRDGAKDLDNLRTFLIKKYGKPAEIYIDGVSMGGTIVTLMAETRTPTQYTGFLAISAALDAKDSKNPYIFTCKPNIPILFLSDSNEVDGPNQYMEKSKNSKHPAPSWFVNREGHANITVPEYTSTLNALLDLSRGAKIDLSKDITSNIERTSSSAQFQNGGLIAKISDMNNNYGNITLDICPADFDKLQIHKGDSFTVQHKDKSKNVFLGSQYADVKEGDWIAFFMATGYLRLAINMGNAAKTLDCTSTDSLFIKK